MYRKGLFVYLYIIFPAVCEGQDNGSTLPFVQDSRVKITVDATDGHTYVPGSARQIESLRLGESLGLAFVKNPVKGRSPAETWLRLGGPGYRNLLDNVIHGGEYRTITMADVSELIVQGWQYGLATPFQQMGMSVSPNRVVSNIDAYDAAILKQYYDEYLASKRL